jgi:hypothetical protein
MREIRVLLRGFLAFTLVVLTAGPCFAAVTCDRVAMNRNSWM